MRNFDLKIITRRIFRNKVFSLLNIAGLATGIASCLLVFLITRYELSVDRFHKNAPRIYRVVSTETYRNGLVDYDGDVPLPLPTAFRAEFRQPEKVAAVYRIGDLDFTLPDANDKPLRNNNVYYCDPELFGIFDFPWLEGNAQKGLAEPYTAAITKSVAAGWFGDWHHAMGKTILAGTEHTPYKIIGVMEDIPSNTDITLQVVLSYASFRIALKNELTDPKNWDNFDGSSQCFFLLAKGQRIESMEAQLPAFVATHYTPLFAGSDTRDSSYFQPLKEMHFDKRLYRFGNAGWSYPQLASMILIGLFILIMGCINFINLSTAQSLNRGKEVGIKKVLGSNPKQLLYGFLSETGVLVLVSLVLGVLLAWFALPVLRNVLQQNIPPAIFISWQTGLFLATVLIIVTLLAGFYPGFILSRFDPIKAIKNNLQRGNTGGNALRRGLIVLQFVIAQVLLVGTIVVGRQMDFFYKRPMGFDKENIVLMNLPHTKEGLKKLVYIKSRIMKVPGVLDASVCSRPPSSNAAGTSFFTFENHSQPEDFETTYRWADTAYFTTFHISLAAGRYPYSKDSSSELLVNETMVKRLGFSDPAQVVGKFIRWGGVKSPKITITGVVHDFQTGSLKEKIDPLLLLPAMNDCRIMAVKINPTAIARVQPQLKRIFAEEYPGVFYDAGFFDDMIAGYYNSEAIASKLFRIFSVIAVFISCLGLYGLVAFMAVQKTKEVGIRKVLGASVQSIIILFSKEFTGLIALSFLIAAPLGYFIMTKWLAEFSYHINIGWSVFAAAVILSVLIAWLTVGFKALGAAMANPVKSLRSE